MSTKDTGTSTTMIGLIRVGAQEVPVMTDPELSHRGLGVSYTSKSGGYAIRVAPARGPEWASTLLHELLHVVGQSVGALPQDDDGAEEAVVRGLESGLCQAFRSDPKFSRMWLRALLSNPAPSRDQIEPRNPKALSMED